MRGSEFSFSIQFASLTTNGTQVHVNYSAKYQEVRTISIELALT